MAARRRGNDAQLAEVSAAHAQRWQNKLGEGQTTKWSGTEDNDAERHDTHSQWERPDGHECDADRHDKVHAVGSRAKRRRTSNEEDDDVWTWCPAFGWLTQSEVQRQIHELNDMVERYIEDQKREREREHGHVSASTRTCNDNNERDPLKGIDGGEGLR